MPAIKSLFILLGFCCILIACSQSSDKQAESAAYDEEATMASADSVNYTATEQSSELAQKERSSRVPAAFLNEASELSRAPQSVPEPSTVAKPRPEDLSSVMFLPTHTGHKFVLTANARFRVKDVYDAAIEIENMAYGLDGFIVKNQISTQNYGINDYPQENDTLLRISRYARYSELIVRVPAANAQAFLRKLTTVIQYLDQREFFAQDVQFEILREQLAYKRNQEIQQKFGQAAARSSNENRVDAIDHQRDTMLTRDNAIVDRAILNDKVAYSTIHLTIYEPEAISQEKIANLDAITEKNQPGFFNRLSDALSTGWYGFLDCIILISVLWPLALIAIVVIAIVIFARRRNKTAE